MLPIRYKKKNISKIQDTEIVMEKCVWNKIFARQSQSSKSNNKREDEDD